MLETKGKIDHLMNLNVNIERVSANCANKLKVSHVMDFSLLFLEEQTGGRTAAAAERG